MIRKFMYQNFSLISLIFVLFISWPFIQSAYADEYIEDDNRYDGSEFNASSFRDNDFGKTDYKELRSTNPFAAQSDKDYGGSIRKDGGRLLRKRQENNGVSVVGSSIDEDPIKNASGHVIAEERTGPVKELPGDWVPDKLNLTSNGGFGIAPDNGSPVPYRLNGHVDIQRGRP